MAKISMDLEAMKAAFAAKGGTVTRVESGVRAIESDRTIYAAMREGTRARADAIVSAERAESQYHARVDAYTAAKADGWSNAAAQGYADHAKA